MMKNLINLFVLSAILHSCSNQNEARGVFNDKSKILIKECPQEKIINKMPSFNNERSNGQNEEYFIYNGERREIGEFDAEWLKNNCNITTTVVH